MNYNDILLFCSKNKENIKCVAEPQY